MSVRSARIGSRCRQPGQRPRDVEEIGDDLRLRACVALDDFEGVRRASLRQQSAAEQRDPPEDGVERRPQLVGHHREELVLQPVGFLGRAARALERQLQPFLIVDVGGRTEPLLDTSTRVADRHSAPEEPPPLTGSRVAQPVLERKRLFGRCWLAPTRPRPLTDPRRVRPATRARLAIRRATSRCSRSTAR